ncbi:MAG: tRNA (adenosine(37)-N6)-threonylcarbamoyltransferase complex ATPase subunit type 1 TsaE [Bdellovibrionaceae bacterium]|nr:tRNA (adenosine(37)-N6)-threonylcarbamoyltransferase complex ATPase subunit type 1 TsaE [Pseudobdellovibrionaceae bacterium]
MKTHKIKTLEELRAFARDLIPRLTTRQVLLLDGPMGTGKTQLVRFLLEELGSDETASPSFAIHNEYETTRGRVDHIDLYRLESEDELESTGFWDLFSAPDGLIIIEWADRLPANHLPPRWSRLALRFSMRGGGEREVTEMPVAP